MARKSATLNQTTDLCPKPQILPPGAGGDALRALIDTLPMPAAIVTLADGSPEVVISNAAFSDQHFGTQEHARVDPAILDELVAAAGRSDSGRTTRRWTTDDPLMARCYDVTAARIELPSLIWPHFMVSFQDRTSEIESHECFRRETMRDSLTGMPNRAGFEDEVDNRLRDLSRVNGPTKIVSFAIITLDMTRFSQINECAGSVVGDELIITVARRMMGRMRKNDIVGRIGGNEFAVFVPLRKGEKEVHKIVERIRAIFDLPYRLSDLEIQIDGAIGVAIGKPAGNDCATYIRQSQLALKRAKITRHTEIYTPDALDKARRRFTLETELRKAIERDQLQLHFQPLIDMNNGFVIGYEALARWEDPAYGSIPPVEFIPVAEDCGLIVPLGRWAIDRACKVMRDWENRAGETLPIKFSVNVSAVQFARDDIPKAVADILQANGTDPRKICLELTESVVVSDPERAAQVMHALRDMNIALAMDDFGTGYSNLAYLQQLPIDVLKIDRSFISRMLEERDQAAIVRAVLSLASALGIETTAEGIESKQLYNALAALGCSYGQGYYFSKPLPEDMAYAYMIGRTG
ncbi:putative bifunctional diguanylate cyclase/phosphodiesterase [Blastomonas sp.]|uniref:putative bifunctional diguanylate cyclase/phosphodiesterase n=1 Tax=Blastomonas sp. TaxID=1909299 RepID=UPI003594798D